MLAAIRAGEVERVVCWHTDRLHRSPLELEEWIAATGGEHTANVLTLTVQAGSLDLNTAEGRLRARISGAVARHESEHKSERIKRKKLEMATDGKFSGGPIPFGYRRAAGDIVVDTEQAAEVRNAVRAIINGASIGSVVRDLNRRGVRTSRGGEWTSTAVRNLVVRPSYAGLTVYQGHVVGESEFPPIVTEDEWRTATRIVKDPSRARGHDAKVRHLLAGLVRCGMCGAAMKTSSRAKNAGENRFYYKCPSVGGGHAFQNARPLEDYISGIVVARLQRSDALDLFGGPGAEDQMAELQQQAFTLRQRLDEAAESFSEGSINVRQMETITARINAELGRVETEMSHARGTGVLADVPQTAVPEWWEAASLEKRRAVIDALAVFYVDPIGKSAPRVFDPTRVRIEPREA